MHGVLNTALPDLLGWSKAVYPGFVGGNISAIDF